MQPEQLFKFGKARCLIDLTSQDLVLFEIKGELIVKSGQHSLHQCRLPDLTCSLEQYDSMRGD